MRASRRPSPARTALLARPALTPALSRKREREKDLAPVPSPACRRGLGRGRLTPARQTPSLFVAVVAGPGDGAQAFEGDRLAGDVAGAVAAVVHPGERVFHLAQQRPVVPRAQDGVVLLARLLGHI